MSANSSRPQVHVGMATVAEWIGVSPSAVAIYLKRYAETERPCPTPDVVIAEEKTVPGWLPEREEEWKAWAKNRPGRGAGGGRPPGSGRSREAGRTEEPAAPAKPKAARKPRAAKPKTAEPKVTEPKAAEPRGVESSAPPAVFSGK